MRYLLIQSQLMHLRKIILVLLPGIVILSGCKKDKAGGTPGINMDDCTQSAGASNGDIIEGRYIVVYKSSEVSARGMNSTELGRVSKDVLARHSISPRTTPRNFGGEPGGFIADISATDAEALKNDQAVAIVEPDRIISLGTCFTVVEPRLVTWNITRTGYGDGTGKTAWVIDTGIDFDHPDLTVDVARSKSFMTNITSARDENGHGTHVAGIIGAKNNRIGVLGVASGATLVSLRVLDKDGSGTVSSIVQALAYVNTNAAAGDVVNMSVGDDEGISAALDQQVQNIAARGIYFAIAAGNEHESANKSSPGRANGANIFTVSAIDSLDNFASFSNFGNDVVDYAEPGVRILSTYMGSRYAYMSGTSMAAPHMAGLLLLKGRNIVTSGTAKNDSDGTADPIGHF